MNNPEPVIRSGRVTVAGLSASIDLRLWFGDSVIRRSGFPIRAVEIEELLTERISAAKRHGRSHHREVKGG